MNKDSELAKQILEDIGGKDNVEAAITCMTRLRITVKDDSKVNLDKLKRLDGVLGVVQSETLQVVLGPGKVTKVGKEFSKQSGVPLGEEDSEDSNEMLDEVKERAKKNKAAQKAKHDKPLQRGLHHIANVFIPLLPGIIAAGLVNGICNVIDYQTGSAFANDWWYLTIKTIGWGLFAFLPIFVGMNAAKEFKGSAILGGIGGIFCLNLTGYTAYPLNSLAVSMPITNKPYVAGVGGLLTALFMGIFIAWTERQIRKFMPNALDTFLTPLCTLIFC